MSLVDAIKLSGSLGVSVVLVIAGAWGIWKILNRLLDESFKRDLRVFEESAKRDERIAAILDSSLKVVVTNTESLAKLIMIHDQRSVEAITSFKEVDRFQREEHTEMIKVLNEILLRLKQMQPQE